MRKILSFLLIFSINVPAFALNSTTRELQADFLTGIRSIRNFVKNYGAEQGVSDVTGTNVIVTRNTTSPIEGTGDFSFTIDSATDVVTWSAYDFDKKLSGQTCEAKLRYTADANASNVKFQVYQGASLIASQALQNSSTPRAATITFSCGDLSSATTLKIVGSAATATAMKVDSVQVNESEPVFVTGASRLINQSAHGFTVGQVLYYTGSTYALAKADADTTSEVVGIVSAVVDADSFRLVTVGFVSGLSGLVAGTTYYLSDTSAGALTATAPTAGPSVNKPVLVAVSTNTGYVLQSRGYVIGPASVPSLVMSDWIAFTPTTSYVANVSSATGFYRRVGDTMEVHGNLVFSNTTTSTALSITIPNGLSIDTTKMPYTTAQFGALGLISAYDGSTNSVLGNIVYNTATTVKARGLVPSNASNHFWQPFSEATSNPVQMGAGRSIQFFFTVPIAGWTATSSGQVAAPRSQIICDTGNGFGGSSSGDTKVRNVTNCTTVGSDIVRTVRTTTTADYYTLNSAGIYFMRYCDYYSAGGTRLGWAQNAVSTTTDIQSIAVVNNSTGAGRVGGYEETATGVNRCASSTRYYPSGTILRAMGQGTANATGDAMTIEITKVSN